MPRPARSERVSPDPHKQAPLDNDGLALSLNERIYILRTRAGFASHQELADACRELLPNWITMNRRLIQQIEKGEIPAAEVNDLWLMAIAVACGANAETIFGVTPDDSGDVAPLLSLLARHPSFRKAICGPETTGTALDLALEHSGWKAEIPGQGAFSDQVEGWLASGDPISFDATASRSVLER